jgi:hypothetical protein
MQRDDRVFLMGEEVGVYKAPTRFPRDSSRSSARCVSSTRHHGARLCRRRRWCRDGRAAPGHRVHDVELRAARARSGGECLRRRCSTCRAASTRSRSSSEARTAQRCSCLRSTRRHGSRGSHTSPASRSSRPGTPYDAKGLLKSAIRDDNPVCVLEGEMLYNTKGEVPDEEYSSARQGRPQARGRPLLDHHPRQDGARRDAVRRPAGEGRHQHRRRRSCARSVRWTSRRFRLGEEDQPRRRARGRWESAASAPGRGLHPARLLRLSRRPSCACTRRLPMPYSKGLEKAAKPDLPRRSPPFGKSCISTEPPSHRPMATKSSWSALPHDGEGRLVKWLKNEGDDPGQDA